MATDTFLSGDFQPSAPCQFKPKSDKKGRIEVESGSIFVKGNLFLWFLQVVSIWVNCGLFFFALLWDEG